MRDVHTYLKPELMRKWQAEYEKALQAIEDWEPLISGEEARQHVGRLCSLTVLLGKVFGGSKRKDQGSNPAGANEASREMNKAVRDLAVTVEQISRGNPVQEEDPGLIAAEESPRCRLCNQVSCMRLVIARALLLEQQDKRQEAGQLYRELLKNQPYNLYAKTKLQELEETVFP